MMKQKPTIIYENTVTGIFVRRINRFTAEVLIDGEPEIVHVKNTGRLQELGFLRKSKGKATKSLFFFIYRYKYLIISDCERSG